MKQLIVLIATIVLGIAIAAMIIGFKSDATTLTNSVKQQITNTFTTTSAIEFNGGDIGLGEIAA